MKKIVKEYAIYILVFVFFFLILLFFNVRNADTIWNYGMAHAIRIGEIPYKDFNIITTPLYPIVMSLLLFIKDSYLVYMLEQAFFCTVLFYFVHKMLNKKWIIFFFITSFPFFTVFLPNYNFLAFLIVILIICFEKKEIDDKWIGLLLGFLFITKHTIGIVFIFFSLLSTFNWKRIGKRLLYSLIPISIFILYLLITKSFMSFMNLSIFGLFDFGKKNHSSSIIFLLISILLLFYNLYLLKKNPKDKMNYYLLSSFSFIVPIVNIDHCMFLIGLFLLVILEKVKENKMLLISGYVLTTALLILNFNMSFSYYYDCLDNSFDKFHARFMSLSDSLYVKKILKNYNTYENSYMISMDSMLYDIESNHKITYFDIPLYGNFGYNGIDKLKKDILSMHKSYFFIQDSKNPQFIQEVCDFIKEKGGFVKKIGNYEVYYIE